MYTVVAKGFASLFFMLRKLRNTFLNRKSFININMERGTWRLLRSPMRGPRNDRGIYHILFKSINVLTLLAVASQAPMRRNICSTEIPKIVSAGAVIY